MSVQTFAEQYLKYLKERKTTLPILSSNTNLLYALEILAPLKSARDIRPYVKNIKKRYEAF